MFDPIPPGSASEAGRTRRDAFFLLLSAPVLAGAFLAVRAAFSLLSGPGRLPDVLGAVVVALAYAAMRERALFRLGELLGDRGPDYRAIAGEFAATTRESLDLMATCDAFLAAVEAAVAPGYQVILLRRPDGTYGSLAARGTADVEALVAAGPPEDQVNIPLRVGDKVIGRLLLGPPVDGGEFSTADFSLIDSLGQSLALSIRNAQLFHQLAGQERLKRELEIAYDVQTGLLPKSVPVPLGAALAASCVPAQEVGGDLYDFVQIDATRWGIFIADVSGKGVPAALMMAVTLTLFRALAPGVPSPASTLARLSKMVHRNRPSNRIFVTALYMIYDARDGSVLIANAGHPKPLLDGEPVEIKGLPLGIDPRVAYRETRVHLEPHSTLVAYSDGIEDVENEQGTLFGPDRVMAFFRDHRHLGPDEARAALTELLACFAGRATPADDQTVAILQRREAITNWPDRSAARTLVQTTLAEARNLDEPPV